MAYKVWVDTETLTAAGVNDNLQEQVIASGYTSIPNLSAGVTSPNTGQYADVTGIGLVRFNSTAWAPAAGRIVASLRATSTQALTSGTAVAITFSVADINLLGGWTSGSRFTAPVSGWFEFTGGVSFVQTTTVAGRRQATFYKNGVAVAGSQVMQPGVPAASTERISAAPTPISLNAADYVELWGMADGGFTGTTSVNSNAVQSSMAVKYLGPI